MAIKVLWPRTHRGDHAIEIEALGEGMEGIFAHGFDDVTDEQWAQCEGLVGATVPTEYLPKMPKCRILVKLAVGFDDVDIQAYGEAGIAVCNTPDYGTREVADHAIALMMTLVKSIAFHDEALRQDPLKNWRPALNPYGRRLSDCTFGVVGLGRIGTATIRRAQAFDMDCVFYDPYKPNGVELALGVRRVDTLAELMGQCDVVSIHTPLNDETRNLIDKAALESAKRGIIVINTARGPIIDIDALHDAMKEDIVLAAGLDVLPDEPANLNKPLIAAWHTGAEWLGNRLVITPHSAFFTPESVRDIQAFSARTAARYLRDGRLENLVNAEFLTDSRQAS
jgi:phosphoglycerate dehydrogenase-like enzyme